MKLAYGGNRIRPPGIAQLDRSSKYAYDAIVCPFNTPSLLTQGAHKELSGSIVSVGGAAFVKNGGLGAARLTAAGEWVDFGNVAPFHISAFTVLVAFRMDTFSTYNTVLEKSFEASTSSGSFQIQIQSDGTVNIVNDNTVVIMAAAAGARKVQLGKINVIAASYDNTTCQVALDGYDLTQATTASTVLNSDRMVLGAKKGDSSEITRPMDFYLFGFWPRALPAKDLVILSRNPSQLFVPQQRILVPPSASVINHAHPFVFVAT